MKRVVFFLVRDWRFSMTYEEKRLKQPFKKNSRERELREKASKPKNRSVGSLSREEFVKTSPPWKNEIWRGASFAYLILFCYSKKSEILMNLCQSRFVSIPGKQLGGTNSGEINSNLARFFLLDNWTLSRQEPSHLLVYKTSSRIQAGLTPFSVNISKYLGFGAGKCRQQTFLRFWSADGRGYFLW